MTTCGKRINKFIVCDAKRRVYHPFGIHSRGRTVFVREHHKDCRYKQKLR